VIELVKFYMKIQSREYLAYGLIHMKNF